ncbi:MAG TPA: lipopolysaccharide assembly protein LapA domain-containing protein [Hypericibacter adhaerens]|uniref:lipopolysaccharide assembly protein LapA domain-containing protein n=1 Tax=Hypericibacter adhaerens TaxID=2602016 RepID=UPI00177B8A17|nr:lipopolysaccharide assembly protein LapA domain-containing protein [Hypericibacter adhaerens]HWA41809.1 lipopolysaccharide assembly protein LapA domain-containing protein [Hypericibacter adhaerens]
MKRLSFIVTLPVTLVILVFALSNRGRVGLMLWPFDVTIDLPIYLVVLGSLLLGFLLGGLIAWFAGGRHRRQARRLHQESRRQAAELADLKKRHSAAAAAPTGSALTVPPQRPPLPSP